MEEDKSLVGCGNCGRGYELKNMHEIADFEGNLTFLCEACYEKWEREVNETLNNVPY